MESGYKVSKCFIFSSTATIEKTSATVNHDSNKDGNISIWKFNLRKYPGHQHLFQLIFFEKWDVRDFSSHGKLVNKLIEVNLFITRGNMAAHNFWKSGILPF